MTKFIWKKEIWEHDEYIITARPDWEVPSKAVLIGSTLSSRDAEIVKEWLQTSYMNLRTLFYNEFKDGD